MNSIEQKNIGIDVSCDKLDIHLDGKHSCIENKTESIRAWVQAHAFGDEVPLAILESTGGYERQLIRTFESFLCR